MTEIVFSIVIPLYNKEQTIDRAIESILNQSYDKFEIIIVDDGSTDNSLEKAKNYEDSRIKIYKQKNSGVSSARNKGIEKAKYNYIGFLDADDMWKKNFLKEIVFLINKYPDRGLYATGYEFHLENNSTELAEYSNLSQDFRGEIRNYFKYTLNNPLISASSVVIPKKTFKEVGFFDNSLAFGEDLDMWFRIALEKSLAFTNKSLAIYYQNASDRACNRDISMEKDFIKKIISNMDFYKSSKNSFNNEYIKTLFVRRIKSLILSNKRKEARYVLHNLNSRLKYLYYIISYIPNFIIILLLNLKKKIRND